MLQFKYRKQCRDQWRDIQKIMKYKKALVTGGAGFIGSHLVDTLYKNNIEVLLDSVILFFCSDNFY